MKKIILCALIFFLPLGLKLYLSDNMPKTIKAVFLDDNENVYFVTENEKNIIITKKTYDGEFTGKFSTPRYYGYNYVLLCDLIFAEGGRAFCAFVQIDSRDFSLKNQVWLEIDFSSGKHTLIYESEIQENREFADLKLAYSDGKLSSITAYSQMLHIREFNVDEKIIVYGKKAVISFSGDIISAYPTPAGNVLISNSLGEIYSCEIDNTYLKLYDGEGNTGTLSNFTVDKQGNTYLFMHGKNRWIMNNAVKNPYDFREASIIQLNKLWNGYIRSENNYAVLSEDKKSAEIYDNGKIYNIVLYSGMCFDEIIFIGLLGLLLAVILYFVFMLTEKNKIIISLLFKQAIMIFTALGIGFFIIILRITDVFEKEYEDELINTLLKSSYETAHLFSEGELFPDNKDYRIKIISQKENEFYQIYCDGDYIDIPIKYTIGERVAAKYSEPAKAVYYNDDNSDWLSVVIPVFNSGGNTVTLIETSVLKRHFIYKAEKSVSVILPYILMITGIIAVLLLLGFTKQVCLLKKLERAFVSTEKGEYKKIKVKGNDEVTKVTLAFNKMIEKTEKNINNFIKTNNAYARFLPSELLERLGKENAMLVKQGDCASLKTHILYISIINFLQATEKMSDNEVFEFFNRICKDVLLIAMSWGGWVESYNHMEFICLFENENGVLEAAKAINARLNSLNKTYNYNLKTVISLTYGNALIGVAGYDERLGTLTISEAVTLARIFTKIGDLYGSDIIYPDGSVKPNSFRILGTYTFNNKKIRLFDCFENKENDIFLNRKQLIPLFEQGITAFENGEWKESKLLFIKYLRKALPDLAAKQYLYLCEHNINNPEKPLYFGCLYRDIN